MILREPTLRGVSPVPPRRSEWGMAPRQLPPSDFPALRRGRLETLQVNLGYRCNQTCVHCHVEAGPHRSESMSRETADQVLEFLRSARVRTLDLTGGAPELHPMFRYLVTAACNLGLEVSDRSNLTILSEPGQEDLADFLALHRVRVIASLPCYLEENVDAQRGRGVFARSLRALRRLNALGYGHPGTGLVLDLVHNPLGAVLPPPQESLEADYKARLRESHGLEFNRLLTLANMPIRRFAGTLAASGGLDAYLALLRGAHDEGNLGSVMCRGLISVDWQGYVYDCDFNQMLGLGLESGNGRRTHLRDLRGVDLTGRPIAVAGHCFGCTAGQGSSCGGALAR